MNTRGHGKTRAKSLLIGASLWLALVAGLMPASAQEPGAETATIGPVSADQTLWSIARDARPDRSVSIHQFMLALVARNPDAFAAGNVNMLREGSVLEIPTAGEALAVPAAEAGRRVNEQMQWYAELSRDEVQALHREAAPDDQTGRAAESLVEADVSPDDEVPDESGSGLETTPLAGPEPAPLETEPEEVVAEEIPETTESVTEAVTADASVPEADEDPLSVEETVGEIETVAEQITSDRPTETESDGVGSEADETTEETTPVADAVDPAPVAPSASESSVEPAAPAATEPEATTGGQWSVLVVLGVFVVAVLMVLFMLRRRPAQESVPVDEALLVDEAPLQESVDEAPPSVDSKNADAADSAARTSKQGPARPRSRHRPLSRPGTSRARTRPGQRWKRRC